MFEKLRKPKRQIVEAQNFEYDELPEVLVSQQTLLKKHGKIYETPSAFFFLDPEEDVVYRAIKPDGTPRVIKVKRIEINYDSFVSKITLSVKELFDLAKHQKYWIFETEEKFIVTAGMIFEAPKERGESKCNG